MIYTDITNTLNTIVKELYPEYTVVAENERFKPKLLEPFVRTWLLPAQTTRETLGAEGCFRYPGFFQISFFVPAQSGTAANELVDRLVELVQLQPLVDLGEGTVHLQSVTKMPSLTETDWFHIPARLSFVAYA